MNKEEERNYVFAQLSSLPNAFQYVSVTNYIENLEQENKKYKEVIEKAIEYEEEIMYLANKVAIITQNVEIKAIRDRLEEIFEILKGEE